MGHRIAMHVVYRMASFYEDHARDHVRALGRRRTWWGAGERERAGTWNVHFTSTMCISLECRALLLTRNYAYYCMACLHSYRSRKHVACSGPRPGQSHLPK